MSKPLQNWTHVLEKQEYYLLKSQNHLKASRSRWRKITPHRSLGNSSSREPFVVPKVPLNSWSHEEYDGGLKHLDLWEMTRIEEMTVRVYGRMEKIREGGER